MNIGAAKALMDLLKTNLGPKGTLKMLVSGAGEVKITKGKCVCVCVCVCVSSDLEQYVFCFFCFLFLVRVPRCLRPQPEERP